ncbi:MAG: DUF3413 domain-containing protein, partial [Deltaproteobacteria bacterium]|nr:DUF3413 domain-containing protein [Deltaproteobacteria bacterium]
MVPPAPQPPGRKQLFFWLGWMWLANVLLLTFIAGGYLRYGNLPSNWEERFFLLLAFPGQMMFLAMIPALPVAAWIGAAPLLRKALRLSPGWGGEGVLPPRLLALAGFTFLAGLVAVDTQVFQLFRFHINSVVWHLLTGG